MKIQNIRLCHGNFQTRRQKYKKLEPVCVVERFIFTQAWIKIFQGKFSIEYQATIYGELEPDCGIASSNSSSTATCRHFEENQ